MQVILRATRGPAAGMTIVIRRGQVAQVGRSTWADFPVPGDHQMADVHFAIENDPRGCRVRDLGSGAGIFINGAKVIESGLSTGDEIAAGQTFFTVLVEGQSPRVVQEASGSSASDSASIGQGMPFTLTECCRQVALGESVAPLLEDDPGPEPFVRRLADRELFQEAIAFLANWLPKATAVAWACQCLREVFAEQLTDPESKALQAAEVWASDPGEENRRAAEAAAEAAPDQSAPIWAARAAFWSGGSLSPPGLPEVAPAAGLAARAIVAALAIASSQGNPLIAKSRFQRFLKLGTACLAPG